MSNLSSAIIEARKRHEAEIAERLKRRQMRQRAEVERLNAKATEESAAPAIVPSELEAPAPPPEPAPPRPQTLVEPPVEPSTAALAPVEPAVPVAPTPPRPKAIAATDDVEKLPDGRFLRLRNDIIDRIK